MPQIIVNVDAEGNTTVEAQGVVGSNCRDLTRAIENAIGRTIGDQAKPEMHQTAQAGQSNTARQQ